VPEEGLAKTGNPVTPPPPTGLAPTTQATANVVLTRAAGTPQPAIRFGSVVCQ